MLLTVAFGCVGCSGNIGSSLPRKGALIKTIGSELPGTFSTHDRENIELSDYRGKAVVLVFGYTQCPDICPTTMQHWQSVFASLPIEAAKSAQMVFVSVDPDRDSPELLAGYMEYFNPNFHGLHADRETIKALLSELHTFARKVPSRTPGQYSMDHSGSAYLIDSRGVLVDELPFGTDRQSSAARLSDVIY